MIIVAGHLFVDPARRDSYLAGCRDVMIVARATPGCLDFCLSPDSLDPARINVFELWADRVQLDTFRGNGPDDDQKDVIRSTDIREYVVQ